MNCDIGEAPGAWHESHEPELLGLVTSANVACGGHAGDVDSMRAVCAHAVRLGVAIGAQVSYPDRAGFGRTMMEISPDALALSLREQYDALWSVAAAAGSGVSYVKPHGALYNAVVAREDHARVVVELAAQHEVDLFGLAESATERFARQLGVRFVREWFADRAYIASGVLAPRSRVDALVTSPGEVRERTRRAVVDGVVDTVDGVALEVDFRTICVHSDTPGAAELLRSVRDAIRDAGAEIAAV
ncbi:MAG: 5-oxoprolinase subunit PxpA [Acidimicrobiia bacterium]